FHLVDQMLERIGEDAQANDALERKMAFAHAVRARRAVVGERHRAKSTRACGGHRIQFPRACLAQRSAARRVGVAAGADARVAKFKHVMQQLADAHTGSIASSIFCTDGAYLSSRGTPRDLGRVQTTRSLDHPLREYPCTSG